VKVTEIFEEFKKFNRFLHRDLKKKRCF